MEPEKFQFFSKYNLKNAENKHNNLTCKINEHMSSIFHPDLEIKSKHN